jgi:hypothetical protein
MTHHPQGNAYLEDFARAVDDLMAGPPGNHAR